MILKSINFRKQTASVKSWFIGESCRLVSDMNKISDWWNIEDFLVTMDMEKGFDSLKHDFISSVLRKIGFGKTLITWIEISLQDQLSCAINGGAATQNFNLERGARQDISAYFHTEVGNCISFH